MSVGSCSAPLPLANFFSSESQPAMSDAEKVNHKELLESVHHFPCEYMIKVIGKTDDEFEERAVAIFREALELEFDPPYVIRKTAHERHCSLTFNLHYDNADQVLLTYQMLKSLDGLVLLL
jgi:putative lipoic acid-binding regulatory protein